MLGRGALLGAIQPLRFVAGGVVSGTIPVSTSGADVGDLILVISAHESGAISLSGSGWTHSSYTWDGGTYTGEFWWKVLDAKADITITSADLGVVYVIYRGPTSAAKVASAEGSSPLSTTFPAPAANCVGQLVIAHQQATTSSMSISNWTGREMAAGGTVMWYYAGDHLFTTVTGAVSLSITTTGGATDTYANAIELRR